MPCFDNRRHLSPSGWISNLRGIIATVGIGRGMSVKEGYPNSEIIYLVHYIYIKWNTRIHNYKGDHKLKVYKKCWGRLNPIWDLQLLRFEEHAHGNMMLWWNFDKCTYYKLPTTYMALSLMFVLWSIEISFFHLIAINKLIHFHKLFQ